MRTFEAAALVEMALPKARRVAARPVSGRVGRTFRTRDARIVQTRRLPAVVLAAAARRRRRDAVLFRAGLLERIVPLLLAASGRFHARGNLSALHRF